MHAAKAVIVGCGYVGRRLAAELSKEGIAVTAVTQASKVQVQGVQSVRMDFDNACADVRLDCEGSTVYYLVPPQKSGVTDIRFATFVRSVVDGLPAKFVLISTTGVYGDCGGEWVNESASLNPATDRARRRAAAEASCLHWASSTGVTHVILRVPAIYGPNRVPTKRLSAGLVMPPASECGFTNRIHVDDLVRVCRRAGETDVSGVFNVSDGVPTRMIDYFELVAEIWSLPNPTISADAADQLGGTMVSYLSESRKIDNSRMLRALQPELVYADVRLGLESCFHNEQ